MLGLVMMLVTCDLRAAQLRGDRAPEVLGGHDAQAVARGRLRPGRTTAGEKEGQGDNEARCEPALPCADGATPARGARRAGMTM